MDPHNSREGVKEALLDVDEGAAIIMVKTGTVLSGYDHKSKRSDKTFR